MDSKEVIGRVKEIINNQTRGCLCAWYESCDMCDRDGAARRIKRDIEMLEHEINGTKPEPIDYGRGIKIDMGAIK